MAWTPSESDFGYWQAAWTSLVPPGDGLDVLGVFLSCALHFNNSHHGEVPYVDALSQDDAAGLYLPYDPT